MGRTISSIHSDKLAPSRSQQQYANAVWSLAVVAFCLAVDLC
jgi:hypothetical protein